MSGDLPEGWQEARLGQLARVVKQRNIGNRSYPVLSVTKHRGFVRSSEYFTKTVHSADTEQYKLVRKGQFAYATIHLDEGSIDLLHQYDAGLISPMYTVFEVKPGVLDPSFALRSLKRLALLGRFEPYSNGGVNRRRSIAFSDLAAYKYQFPPYPEQLAIAEVLQSIEDAIARTQKVIDATRSVRDALIRKEIAKVHAAKRIVRLETTLKEGPRSGLSPVVKNSPPGVGVLRLGAIDHGTITPSGNTKFAELPADEARRFQLRAGDFYVVRGNGSIEITGDGALLLEKDIPSYPCIFPDLLIRLRFDCDFALPEYISAIWGSPVIRKQILKAAKSTNGIWKINQTDLKELLIPLPDIAAQQTIAALHQRLGERIDGEERSLAELQNIRAALTQELLSGRLRLPAAMVARFENRQAEEPKSKAVTA